MIVRTLGENFIGNKFTAYQDGDKGVFVCHLFDAATLYVDNDEHDIENKLYAAEEHGPEAIDAVCSTLKGEWQRLPARDLGLLVFHA